MTAQPCRNKRGRDYLVRLERGALLVEVKRPFRSEQRQNLENQFLEEWSTAHRVLDDGTVPATDDGYGAKGSMATPRTPPAKIRHAARTLGLDGTAVGLLMMDVGGDSTFRNLARIPGLSGSNESRAKRSLKETS
jgi:hypothetical protein